MELNRNDMKYKVVTKYVLDGLSVKLYKKILFFYIPIDSIHPVFGEILFKEQIELWKRVCGNDILIEDCRK